MKELEHFSQREPEKLSDFAWRIGVPLKTVSRKLRHPKCPAFGNASIGNRVQYLVATRELEHFMRTNPRSL